MADVTSSVHEPPPIVDGYIGAERARKLELALVASCRDHERSGALGELHQQRSDAARRSLDEHRRPRLDRRPVQQPERSPAVG